MNAPLSRNPADDETLLGTFKEVLTKFLQDVDDMLPARVISYNRATNRARVQPLVMVMSTETDGSGQNRNMSRAQVASVPVLQIGGGGFFVSFPLKAGDLGWIKASDRDISLFLQSYAEARINTLRKHKFEDGVFIPDIMRGYTVAAEDDDSMVISSVDGTVKVALGEGTLTLTAPELAINAALTTVTGSLTVVGSTTINGIDFNTHKHTGVQTGSGISGEPVA